MASKATQPPPAPSSQIPNEKAQSRHHPESLPPVDPRKARIDPVDSKPPRQYKISFAGKPY